MSKLEQTEVKIADKVGFHEGHRIYPGETFTAPASFTGKWFRSADAREADASPPSARDLTAREIKAKVGDMTSEEIKAAIAQEQGSQNRRSVLALLNDELANRVGRTEGANTLDDLLN